jgi:hypothetical protein
VLSTETSVSYRNSTRRLYPEDFDMNIMMDLREVGWEGVDWIHLAQDRC